MRIRIIVAYHRRYRRGHGADFVPPITGLHLAALTPSDVEVEVVHQQVRAVPIRADVDLVALSFFSGFAEEAYAIADAYRALGVAVVAGGPHASYWSEEVLRHADAVVTGECEDVWERVVRDAGRGALERVYRGKARPMAGLPTPRYELLENRFVVRRVIQATRGCPYACSFCSVPDLSPGFRTRPVDELLRDIATSSFAQPIADKVVWFWDDNLLVKRAWAKSLLEGMRGMGKWWLTQASIDVTEDPALLRAMERSGCAGVFLGIESVDEGDLRLANKGHNRVSRYARAIDELHDRGICVMAGFIAGFDGQTPSRIVAMADSMQQIGVDVPFLSILTPFRGTPLYDDLLASDRLLDDRGWRHFDGYNVAFRPHGMTPEALVDAHRALWRRAFSPSFVAARLARAARLGPGGAMLSAAMNGFYGFKRLTRNEPRTADPGGASITHAPREASRLAPRARRGLAIATT